MGCSSVGSSVGLLIRMSQVRALPPQPGSLAQRLEQRTFNAKVIGSIPITPIDNSVTVASRSPKPWG